MKNLDKKFHVSIDEKVVQCSGMIALVFFVASMAIAAMGLVISTCLFCSSTASFFMFIASLNMFLATPIAFPVLTLFFAKSISRNSATKIIFLMINSVVAIFFAWVIISLLIGL